MQFHSSKTSCFCFDLFPSSSPLFPIFKSPVVPFFLPFIFIILVAVEDFILYVGGRKENLFLVSLQLQKFTNFIFFLASVWVVVSLKLLTTSGFFFWSLNMLWFRDWHAPNFLFIFLALFYFLNLYFFESNYEIFSLSLLLLLLLPSFYFKSLVNLSLMQV